MAKDAGEAMGLGTVKWLLEGDPAIRWQTMRDLLSEPDARVSSERARVAYEGWGAALLALQLPDGSWPSDYHPDVYRGRPTSHHYLYKPEGTSTFHSLALLAAFGLPCQDERARRACRLVLDAAARTDGGLAVINDEAADSETCQSGWGLSVLSYFEIDDDRLDTIAAHLVVAQMADSGWNCQRPNGATHASMHTTILVLEGLASYEQWRPGRVEGGEAVAAGREFLLRHHLFRSCRTGDAIEPRTQHDKIDWPPFTAMVFPPQWHYDILRALDYFRAVGAPQDERLGEAVDVVRATQNGGRWLLEHQWLPTAVDIEPIGGPSRWNTLRALRVLRWWDA